MTNYKFNLISKTLKDSNTTLASSSFLSSRKASEVAAKDITWAQTRDIFAGNLLGSDGIPLPLAETAVVQATLATLSAADGHCVAWLNYYQVFTYSKVTPQASIII
jgi:hypothetical protein